MLDIVSSPLSSVSSPSRWVMPASSIGGSADMTIEYLLSGAATVVVLVYLVYALLGPERF